MKLLRIVVALLLAASASILFAQTPTPAKGQAQAAVPLIVDVHASPYRGSINVTVNTSKQRFDMRNATIVNMIDFSIGREDDDGREDNAIVGGPPWLDLDRFDVVAMLPPRKAVPLNDGPVDPEHPLGARAVIKRVLAERFHLTYHVEDRPLPGFIVTLAKDGPKLVEAKDPTAANECQTSLDKSSPGQMVITCTSETIAQLLALFGGTFRHPLIDHTGLTKPYDITLRLPADQLRGRQDSINTYIYTLAKQLGIVIAPGDVPQPAFVVDTVDHSPTPNPPETAKLISARPDLEFEVASIRPALDSEPQRAMRLSGSQITLGSFSMQELLTRAWEFRTGAMIGNRPDWLTRIRYTVLMKLPQGVDARGLSQDSELFDEMLRKLLTDRFQMKYHWGEQTVPDAYVLLPGTPKMKKADPNSRSFCKYGPAEGEKDVRTADSAFNGEFHCQNVTMDQFADLAQAVAGSDIKYRVPNKTGLKGSYEFTLYYTTASKMKADAAAADAAAKQGGDAAAAPAAGLSIEDAFRKELGLKLEKQPGPYPALILDHIEQTPTAN
jgi:uncharacterized protein (TIGR03435 family)